MECWAVHRQSMAVVGVEVPVVLMILVLGQSMEVEPVEDPELLPLPWMYLKLRHGVIILGGRHGYGCTKSSSYLCVLCFVLVKK